MAFPATAALQVCSRHVKTLESLVEEVVFFR